MSFLQPLLLWGLPLIALPIIIHLINQRRYQTVRWAAMMFLLAANRMSRGYARIRRWLIMACRMAAIGALLFAVSRPLAGGWIGLAAGGKADTTIILLDRSPSMRQGAAGAGGSKRETGLRQIVRAVQTLGSARWVLIESGSNQARALESIGDLLTLPRTGPSSAPADLPAMLQTARDFIRSNKAGRTEIWICSDLRANDWNAESGRWQALRDAFLEFPQGVRFHLLAYPQVAPENLSVRVTDVRRQKTADGAELLVSLKLSREGGGDRKESIPLQFEIDGARSVLTVEMAGPHHELKGHRIALGRGRQRGWGRVSIPADANPADDDFYFVYDEPAPRRAVIVAEDAQAARPLQIAAEISPDPAVRCSAAVVGSEQLATVEWESLALLLWQGPLPEGDAARLVRSFIDRGGRVIFFPPREPGTGAFLGTSWTSWTGGDREIGVENWRGDQDLLAHTLSGSPLPVGKLRVRKSCGLKGEFTPLATLRGGASLLARVATNRGGVYFCATTPGVGDSSMATDGVVLYVLVQRALADGAETLARTRQLDAGEPTTIDPAGWTRIAGGAEAISTDYPIHRGVYAAGDHLLAVNRPAAEDLAPVLADRRVDDLFRGLDYARVDDRAGSMGSLIQEIWRLFLVTMLVALVLEAALCLPKPARSSGAPS